MAKTRQPQDATTKRTPFLRLVGVNSDESTVPAPSRTVALLHPDSMRYLDGVTATVQMLTEDEFKAIQQRHRAPEKGPKGVEWKIDERAVMREILVGQVSSWTGIVGADNKPMKLCAAALDALDSVNKAHLVSVARTPAEMVDPEVVAASFR